MKKTGSLITVVGRSGVGKDTLLSGVVTRLQHDTNLVVARRVITRPENAGNEDHESATVEEFMQREANGEFWQTWRAHDLHYALTLDVLHNLQQGQSVLANISRAVIDALIEKWPQTVVVEITAPDGKIEQRLTNRGRESTAQIQSRIDRVAKPLSEQATIYTLCNDGTREEGIDKFEQLIQALRVP